MLVENLKWDIILERIQDDAIPDTAICTNGFWAKVIVPNEKWDRILKRIKDDRIPDRAIKAGGFWSKILIVDIQWNTLLMRIQDAAIPDVAMERNGFWSRILVPSSDWHTILKHLEHPRLQTCFTSSAFWNNCTKDWTNFFEFAKRQKKKSKRYLEKYAREHPIF